LILALAYPVQSFYLFKRVPQQRAGCSSSFTAL